MPGQPFDRIEVWLAFAKRDRWRIARFLFRRLDEIEAKVDMLLKPQKPYVYFTYSVKEIDKEKET